MGVPGNLRVSLRFYDMRGFTNNLAFPSPSDRPPARKPFAVGGRQGLLHLPRE
jgi:hypothetical protein